MKQATLLDPKADIEIPIHSGIETGLTLSEPQPAALFEFRRAFMSMEPAQMLDALGQYKDRREALRAWFLSMMTEGIHYGYPPTMEPKWCDSKGKPCDKESAWGTLGYSGAVSLAAWYPKPSLYAAGADLVCDTMWVRDTYAADMETWQQLGSLPGNIIRKCKLHSRITEEFIGEGTGGRTLGQKKGDLNNSVKMADKSAKVCAVLNCWGLRELFTQDEPAKPEPRESPTADPNAKTAATRGDRVTVEQVSALAARWKGAVDPSHANLDGWQKFVAGIVKRDFVVTQAGNWTKTEADAVGTAINERFDA